MMMIILDLSCRYTDISIVCQLEGELTNSTALQIYSDNKINKPEELIQTSIFRLWCRWCCRSEKTPLMLFMSVIFILGLLNVITSYIFLCGCSCMGRKVYYCLFQPQRLQYDAINRLYSSFTGKVQDSSLTLTLRTPLNSFFTFIYIYIYICFLPFSPYLAFSLKSWGIYSRI